MFAGAFVPTDDALDVALFPVRAPLNAPARTCRRLVVVIVTADHGVATRVTGDGQLARGEQRSGAGSVLEFGVASEVPRAVHDTRRAALRPHHLHRHLVNEPQRISTNIVNESQQTALYQ